MEALLPVIAGSIFAAGVYLLLKKGLITTIIGIMLISNSVNLALFSLGRVTRENPPLVANGELIPATPFANPLPQALILTAIVIGFGLLAFVLALAYRSYKELGTVDQDTLLKDPEDTSKAIVNVTNDNRGKINR
ncbi:MAG: NADH-quinone oxidoreductase subunit K [Balneolales bacterium]